HLRLRRCQPRRSYGRREERARHRRHGRAARRARLPARGLRRRHLRLRRRHLQGLDRRDQARQADCRRRRGLVVATTTRMTERDGATRHVRVVLAGARHDGTRSLEDLLSASGLEVATVSEGLGEALDAAARLKVDVAVVEVRAAAPYELRALEGRRLPCRLVIVAGGEDEDLLLAAVQAGATGVVVRG